MNPISGEVEGWRLRADCNHVFAAAIRAIAFSNQDVGSVKPDLRRMSRGSVGETVLHQALLLKPSSDTPQYNDLIARYLIEHHQVCGEPALSLPANAPLHHRPLLLANICTSWL